MTKFIPIIKFIIGAYLIIGLIMALLLFAFEKLMIFALKYYPDRVKIEDGAPFTGFTWKEYLYIILTWPTSTYFHITPSEQSIEFNTKGDKKDD